MLLDIEVPGEIVGHLGLAGARLPGEQQGRPHGQRHVHGIDQIRIRLVVLRRGPVAAQGLRRLALCQRGTPLGGAVVGDEKIEAVSADHAEAEVRMDVRR